MLGEIGQSLENQPNRRNTCWEFRAIGCPKFMRPAPGRTASLVFEISAMNMKTLWVTREYSRLERRNRKGRRESALPVSEWSIIRICVLVGCLLIGPVVCPAAVISTAGSGNWNSTVPNAPWPGGNVPGASDDVIINAAHSVTVTANASVGSITFSNAVGSKVLTVNADSVLSVTGAILAQNSISASLTNSIAGAGSITCASITVGGTTTPAPPNPNTLETILGVTGVNLTVSGNLTLTGLSGSGSRVNNATFALDSGSVSVGGSVSLGTGSGSTATVSLTNGAASGTLTLLGATPFTTSGSGTAIVNLNGAAAVVNYSGAAQSVNPVGYQNLILSGSGAKAIASGTSVAGNLSVAPTGTATASVGTGLEISVGSLALGGVGRSAGTWGASSSSATHQNDTYFAATTGRLLVTTDTRQTPTVTVWPTADGISYGQALADSALTGGEASVAGNFEFTTPATVPPAGNPNASVTFTPTDIGTYQPVVGSVSVPVAQRALTIMAVTDSKPYDGTTSSAATPTISSGSLVDGDTPNFIQTFDTANIGTGKTLTPSGTVNDGNGGNNYSYTFVSVHTGIITAGAPVAAILVLTNAANPFAEYYGEILLAEGLNSFELRDIAAIGSGVLTNYDVVILGEMALSAGQVTTLSDWVTAGGNLIAMRPDKQLASLLGLTDASATLAEGYLLVHDTERPGVGIVDQTIQFHGTADLYTPDTATVLATLYSNAVTATENPAVTWRNVGSNGGQAAAFTYDLARSVVLTRQGNPAWVGDERDGIPPLRSSDLFYGNKIGDPQPDWVDLSKIAIPQADEQQRLLANMIIQMNADRKLLPRFWYFPHDYKAAIVMTGDDHGNGGTAGRFEQYLAFTPEGSSVADWEAIRGTSYIFTNTPITDAAAANYAALGFEIGLHCNSGCADYTAEDLDGYFSTQLAGFASVFPSLPAPTTHRIHCIAWSGYTILPEVGLQHGIRMDVSYYYWPGNWASDWPGLFTGSGMPMRFATTNGNIIDVYQAASQMTDESGQIYPYTANVLLDRALGPEGYYGFFVANMHTDFNAVDTPGKVGSDAIVNAALSRGVPVITARQLLEWVDGRNSSTIRSLISTTNTESFTVVADSAAHGLQVMVPIRDGYSVSSVAFNGDPATYTVRVVKGIHYAVIPAATGDYDINFVTDTTPPIVMSVSPAAAAVDVSLSTKVQVVFSEAMNAATINTTTIALQDPSDADVPALVTYNPSTFTATLQPVTPLELDTVYTVTVAGVTDVAGVAIASAFTSSFTTDDQVSPSLWADSVEPAIASANDDGAVEVGVKFQSAVAGYVMGIRFYKGAANTGTHIGSLWSMAGTSLASVTFADETSSGWQFQAFPAPVAIDANTTYVASYYAPAGGYAVNGGFFTGAGVENYPLRALADGEDGPNGVYRYGTSGFPNENHNGNNYWVDVVFVTELPPDTNGPVVVGVSPADGATNVSIATTVWVAFDEAMTAATVTNAGTLTLSNATAGSLVAATVAYYEGTNTAVLTPESLLIPANDYVVRVLGGSGGAKDLAGNALTNDFSSVFTTEPPDETAPEVVGVSPANGASGVGIGATVVVTFNEAMDVATVTNAGAITLSNVTSGTVVSGVVGYNAGTFTAELVPGAALELGAEYEVRVLGGSGGVKDVAGNALAGDFVTGFSTAAEVSVWSEAALPDGVDGDPSPVTLGVKFRSALDGYVTGIRFYKDELNTGTHVGHLWSNGVSLASAVFTNETASGWQRVDLGCRWRSAANETYVASYYAPAGRGSFSLGYFNSGGQTNYPLWALANGEDGGNGVFVVGANAYPTESGNGNNYWVDVVFVTELPPDTNGPVVVGVSPADGATNVSIATTVWVAFDEAMTAATVTNAGTLTLSNATAGSLVAATVAYYEGTNTAVLTPESLLIPANDYVVRVLGGSGGAKDLAGNALTNDFSSVFTTEPPDETAPEVVGVSPANGASGVGIGATVVVTFNEAMDVATVTNAGAITLSNVTSGTVVSGVVGYNAGTFTAELVPGAALELGAEYEVRVLGGSGGVKDVAGNALAGDFVTGFSTAAEVSVWSEAALPDGVDGDESPVTLGVKFRSALSGYVTGIRFYKDSVNTGTHVGHLWSNGVSLASAVFTNETASGWQRVDLGLPVAVAANETYVASYYAPAGRGSFSLGYFSGGGQTNYPLWALANGEDGGNGVFVVGANAYPTESGNGNNYWVDVVFVTELPPDTNGPVVVGVSPTDGATNVSVDSVVSVTFNEPLNPATVNETTVSLKDSFNQIVPSGLAYTPGSLTVVLTPVSALRLDHFYTLTISGITDVASNAMASSLISTFTTFPAYSIWDDSAEPEVYSASDPDAVEVGLKFQATVPGYVTGIRYYRGPSNPGPHIGNLWASNGVPQGSVEFINESASGWQQQALTNRIAIAADTTYVVSYHAPQGGYATTPFAFTNAGVVNGPLRALSGVEGGGNGVFRYNPTTVFPDEFNNSISANYWVDVVFIPNSPPVLLNPIANQFGVFGTSFNFTFAADTFADSENSPLNYAATGMPPGIMFDSGTRNFSGTPNQAGVFNVEVVASDDGIPALSATNYFTLTISPANATVSLLNLAQTYDGTARVVSATSDPEGLNVVITYEGNLAAPTNAGSYTVIGTINEQNYVGSETNTLVVSPASAVVTLTNLAQVYDGTARVVGATTAPTNLNVTITYAGEANAPTNAGSYEVIATITEPNYVGSATNTLVVSPAAATVTLTNLAQVYDGTARLVGATTEPTNLNLTITYAGEANAPTNAGSYEVIGTITEPNYVGSATNTLVVSPAAATITLTNLAQVYDGTARVVGATTEPPNLNLTITYAGEANAPTNAGSYEVIGTINELNYVGSATNTLVVSPASAVVTLTNLAQVYDGTARVVGATTEPTNLNLTITYAGELTAPTNAGSYEVIATIAEPNYVGSATNTLVVSPAAATVTLTNLAQVYDGTARLVGATTEPTNLNLTITYAGEANAPTNAGSYEVIATITEPNYVGSATNTLVVSPASAVVTLTNLAQVYDGTARVVGATTAPTNLNVTITYAGEANAPTNAGSYEVIATITEPNYVGSATNTLVVSPASAVVTLTNLAQVYDGTARVVGATTEPTNLNLTITYTGEANAPTNAGSYEVIGTITEPNYVGSATNLLVVSPAAATITLTNLAQVYDGTAREVNATTDPEGLNVVITYESNLAAPTNAGSYEVIGTITEPNYVGSATNTLVVSPAAATITLTNLAKCMTGRRGK
jgi:hypothetical protein